MKTRFLQRLRRIDTSSDHAHDQRSTIVDERPAGNLRDDDGRDLRFDGPSHQAALAEDDPRHVDASSAVDALHHDEREPMGSSVAVPDEETRVEDGRTRRAETAPDTRDVDTSTPAIVPESHPAASRGRALLRTPRVAPLAAFGGWAAAWGVAIVALACLTAAGIATGLGLGIADGGPDVADGVTAGLWMAAALGAGFLGGGFVAARMARTAPFAHGVTAWLFALLATAADGLVADRRGSTSVLDGLGLPSWEGNAYSGADLAIPLILFAGASLVGVLIGAALGAAANSRERSPMRQL